MLAVMISKARRNQFTPEYNSPIEITGLYWHFVDIRLGNSLTRSFT